MQGFFSGKNVAWVIPAVAQGSGGMRTILNQVEALRQEGARCDLHIVGGSQEQQSTQLIEENLRRVYGCEGCGVYATPHVDSSYDIAIATMWYTVPFVIDAPCRDKAYFVQDFEPWFYPMGDSYLAAQQSYRSGLPAITIGRWLSHKLGDEFGIDTIPYDFTANENVYQNLGMARENAVCVLYQPEKPRRCKDMTKELIAILRRVAPDTKVYTYGSGESLEMHDGLVVECGILSIEECAKLYNSCRAGVCISSSNPSRIPFEMMACGLPVIDIYGENTLYDYCESAVVLADPAAAALATATLSVMRDSQRRASMSDAGLLFMRDRKRGDEELRFVQALERVLEPGDHEATHQWRTYENRPVIASDETIEAQRAFRASEREAARLIEVATDRAMVTIDGISMNKDVATVTVAVWCAADQSDLHWYTARRETPDRYSIVIDVNNHGSHRGLYHVHVYLNGEDGIPRKAAERDFIVSSDLPTPPGTERDIRGGLARDAVLVVPLTVSIEPSDKDEKPAVEVDGPHTEAREEQTERRGLSLRFWKKRTE